MEQLLWITFADKFSKIIITSLYVISVNPTDVLNIIESRRTTFIGYSLGNMILRFE